MPTYTYQCKEHGPFELRQSMKDAGGTRPCPICAEQSERAFAIDGMTREIWRCQGAHFTDYGPYESKVDTLNRNWSAATGEAPPPPSNEVPRNLKEPF